MKADNAKGALWTSRKYNQGPNLEKRDDEGALMDSGSDNQKINIINNNNS